MESAVATDFTNEVFYINEVAIIGLLEKLKGCCRFAQARLIKKQ